jgi:tRNA A37 N6-isopentenylltransferase MiaA
MATKKTPKQKGKEVLAKQMQARIDEINEELSYPKVVKGSHLTVTTYADGRTELEWDDEALQRDVEQAIAQYEAMPAAGKIAKQAKVTHKYDFDWR